MRTGGHGTLTGTGLLIRHILRRDRVLMAAWSVVLVGVSAASASAIEGLYPGPSARQVAAEAINSSPALVAMYGPILDVTSRGELAMTKLTVLYALFVSLVFLMLFRRHSRVEEETGQSELVGGTAVGRNAPMAAAVIATGGMAVALGVLTALGNTAGGLPWTGSVAFGASWTGIGLVSIAVTAVACQLSESARTCGAIAAGVLGVAYVLRAVGDVSLDWVSWLSPLGWGTQLRAYSETRWWVLGLYLGTAAALLAGAVWLRAHRDLGSGVFASRPGPASAGPRLLGVLSLTARVHASAFAVWAVGSAVLGGVLGLIAPNIGDLLDSPMARRMMERLGGIGAIERTLIAAELSIVVVALTGFALGVVSHAAADEAAGRTEEVIAAGVSRSRVFLGVATIALGGATVLLVVAGTAIAVGFAAAGGSDPWVVVPAALGHAPALWLVATLSLAAFGHRSRLAVLGWVLLVAFFSLGQLGELLSLPQWLVDLSPYTHLPPMPSEGFDPVATAVLAGLAVAAGLFGWWRYRSRDLG